MRWLQPESVCVIGEADEGAVRTRVIRAIYAESRQYFRRLAQLGGAARGVFQSIVCESGGPVEPLGELPLAFLVTAEGAARPGFEKLPAAISAGLLGCPGLGSSLIELYVVLGELRCPGCGRKLPKHGLEGLLGEIEERYRSGVLGIGHRLSPERGGFRIEMSEVTHERYIADGRLVDAERVSSNELTSILSGAKTASLLLRTFSLPLSAESRLVLRDRVERVLVSPAPNLDLFHFAPGMKSAALFAALSGGRICDSCGARIDAGHNPSAATCFCERCGGSGAADGGAACESCMGTGIGRTLAALSVGGLRLIDLPSASPLGLLAWCRSLQAPDRTGEIERYLQELCALGFGEHLLSTPLAALSQGERIRLALSQLLLHAPSDCLILLEEAFSLFTGDEIARTIPLLARLARSGNRVLISSLDERVRERADTQLVAEERDGKIVLRPGQAPQAPRARRSKRSSQPGPAQRFAYSIDRPAGLWGELALEIPSGALVALTGETGSGKTTLMRDILRRAPAPAVIARRGFAFDKIHYLASDDDSAPSLERNLASESGVWEPLLEEISRSYEARLGGFDPRMLGRRDSRLLCEECLGAGRVLIGSPARALAEVSLCPRCRGRRFRGQALTLTLRGRSLDRILETSCEEAAALFWDDPELSQRLAVLAKFGFGAIRLGLSTLEMRVAERQRLRLFKLLRPRLALKKGKGRKGTKPCLFLLDYPFTGMGTADERLMLALFREIASRGDTIVVAANELALLEECDLHYEALIEVDRIVPGAYTHGSQPRRSVLREIPARGAG